MQAERQTELKRPPKGYVRIRLISHNDPKQWREVTISFANRLQNYCNQSKADIWYQDYETGVAYAPGRIEES